MRLSMYKRIASAADEQKSVVNKVGVHRSLRASAEPTANHADGSWPPSASAPRRWGFAGWR